MALLWLPTGTEAILIVLGVLILFGANKIPQFMRGIGQGVRELKKGISSDEETPPAAVEAKDGAEKKT